jgi:hypothetical protein
MVDLIWSQRLHLVTVEVALLVFLPGAAPALVIPAWIVVRHTNLRRAASWTR